MCLLSSTLDRLMTDAGTELRSERPSPRIVLASRSPRRRSLLLEAGIQHRAEHPGFDDGGLKPGNVSCEQWVASLAYLKAWAKVRETDADLIIGADTACVLDDRLIGTPNTAEEAGGMIRSFLNREHHVVTGVALIDLRSGRPERVLFSERAAVRFGGLSEQQIALYISTDEWQGKAGAYNLRERLDAGWPITYDGDPTTIMGLPMKALLRRLRTLV